MPQEAPGRPRRPQEAPGGPRRPQEAPRGLKRPRTRWGHPTMLHKPIGTLFAPSLDFGCYAIALTAGTLCCLVKAVLPRIGPIQPQETMYMDTNADALFFPRGKESKKRKQLQLQLQLPIQTQETMYIHTNADCSLFP